MNINSNKRPIESFVTSIAAENALKTANTLVNGSGNVDLNNGQFGFLQAGLSGSLAYNAFMDSTPIMSEASEVAIVQGTSYSANVSGAQVSYPLPGPITYRTTGKIDFRNDVVVTKEAYRDPAHAIYVVGNTSASAGQINAVNETMYELAIQFKGRRTQEFTSTQENAYLRAQVVTPDFTALSYTDAQKVDYIATNIAHDINRNSKAFTYSKRRGANAPVVAFLVRSAGGTGVAIGGGGPIVAGTSIPTFTYNGTTHNVVLTEAMAASIKAAAVAATSVAIASVTWTIVPVNLATAGTGTEDIIMVMALDETPTMVDFIPEVKVDINVSLSKGFAATVRNSKLTYADEGQGLSRQLELFYSATQAQREYSLRHDLDPVVKYPALFVEGQQYTVYNILHTISHNVDLGSVTEYRKRAVVSIPRYSAGTTPNALIAAFETSLGSLLTSSNNGAIINI